MLWRHLRRAGVLSLGGVHILPHREDCIRVFQSLTQIAQQAKGEALTMHVTHFEGLSDAEAIERFRQARAEEYADLELQALKLEQIAQTGYTPEEKSQLLDAIEKLYKQQAEIQRIDFFDCPMGKQVASRLSRIGQFLSEEVGLHLPSVTLSAYRDKRWVTRPRPRIDRLACIWLIRRYINSDAIIRYDHTPEPDEVAFDMSPSEFGHRGNLCTFEVMLKAFELEDPGLQAIAEIVHEIDLGDGSYVRPEVAGINAILEGWLLAGLLDVELEAQGIRLLQGLYTTFSSQT